MTRPMTIPTDVAAWFRQLEARPLAEVAHDYGGIYGATTSLKNSKTVRLKASGFSK
jgi:hypothetical protein